MTVSYDDTTAYPIVTRTVTNALGRSTTYRFQQVGFVNGDDINQAIFLGADGAVTTNCPATTNGVTYDASKFSASETDEEGRVTAYTRDSLGRPLTITRGSGTPQAVTTTITWHATLNVPTQIVEPGKTTTYTYTLGRLTSMTETDTTTTTVPYVTTGQTRTTTYTYSSTGQLLTVDGPLAGTSDTITYTYGATGVLATVTNQVGHVTTINTVNGRGQPTQITDANGIITDLAYDAQGRLKTITSNPGASQMVTTIDYDAIGQVTKITKPDGAYLQYAYSNAKRLISVTNNTGQIIEYTHDLLGNVLTSTIKASSGAGSPVFSQSAQFDEIGRLLKSIGASTQTTTYAYEKNNNLKSVTDPRSGVYSYAYDSLNRLIRETDQNSSQVNYTLNGQDQVTTYTDPRSLATTYVRNGFGEVIQEVSPDRGTTTHVRDARGLVTQTTDGRGVVTNMTYDALGRIKTKTYPADTAENITYTWDTFTGSTYGRGLLYRTQSQNGIIDRFYDIRGNIRIDRRTINGIVHNVTYTYDNDHRIAQMIYPPVAWCCTRATAPAASRRCARRRPRPRRRGPSWRPPSCVCRTRILWRR